MRQADGSWALAVARAETLNAIRFLNESRLFKDSDLPREKASLVSSRDEQRFRIERSLSRELEQTLTRMEGVLEARVHLNLPVVDPLFGQPLDKNARGGASALLAVSKEFAKKPDEIAALIAGAAGLNAASVTVLLDSGETGRAEAVGAFAAEDPPSGPDKLLPRSRAGGGHKAHAAALLTLAGMLFLGWLMIRRRKTEVWETIDE